jgi:RNA recognition motif-containing protein
MKIYVGNMPFSMNEDELRGLFSQHGTVDSVSVVADRDTGRPRGFAFVEMADDAAAQAAIDALDGSESAGRKLTVNPARPKTDRDRGPRRGGGGGGNRGGGDDRW